MHLPPKTQRFLLIVCLPALAVAAGFIFITHGKPEEQLPGIKEASTSYRASLESSLRRLQQLLALQAQQPQIGSIS